MNGGGINSDTKVLSVVTENLLSPYTFARSGIKNVGTFLLMLLMLQISVRVYHQILAGFLHIQNYSLWMCKHKLALELLWLLYKFQSSTYDQEKDFIYGQILICSGFCLCFYMKILLGNKTLVLISISVSEIGPNVVSEHINLRMVECVFCCMQLFIYPVARRRWKKSINLLFNYSH